MKFVVRAIEQMLHDAAKSFPSLVITGPRRAGKSTLLRRVFPDARYVLLEDPDVQARVRSDPRGLLEELKRPVIFDEIQNTPELFAYVRTQIDKYPRRMGQWLFTGSQETPLMQGVTESMAGRAAILQLLPFSIGETDRATLLTGGYPEVVAKPGSRQLWFSSYIQTYLERDVRSIINVRDLVTFRRFLSLLASRHGQMMNKTDLAAPLGVSVPTITDWLRILEATGQVILVPPYFENFGKRLVKTPKVYFGDSGMACHLLGITTQAQLDRSPFLGALFEGMIAAEILKTQYSRGQRKELYYFRDQQGLEVDFLVPLGERRLWLIECKASKTVLPSMTRPLAALRDAIGQDKQLRISLVHRASKSAPEGRGLSPGMEALDVPAFVSEVTAAYAKPKTARSRGGAR